MPATQPWMFLQCNGACVAVQEEVQRRTNTVVVIKGRYIAPGKPVDDQEGPLRLLVKPGHMPPVSLSLQLWPVGTRLDCWWRRATCHQCRHEEMVAGAGSGPGQTLSCLRLPACCMSLAPCKSRRLTKEGLCELCGKLSRGLAWAAACSNALPPVNHTTWLLGI